MDTIFDVVFLFTKAPWLPLHFGNARFESLELTLTDILATYEIGFRFGISNVITTSQSLY